MLNQARSCAPSPDITLPVTSVVFSPDGRYVLTGSRDSTARLWDAQLGEAVRTLTGHIKAVTSVAFSPDGKYALTGSWDKTARLWDIHTGQVVRSFAGLAGPVTSVAFSPDGEYLLISNDMTAQLWSAEFGLLARTFTTDVVWSAAFSPDGKYVLVGDRAGIARLWDFDMLVKPCMSLLDT